ncbi:MAG: DUF4337 family protein [Acetobacteraceae bacterium]
MSDSIEHAREGIERAHHAHETEGDSTVRWVAVLVALFAAALALAEVGEKASQTEFLMNHISMTDDYAYYQAKNLRVVSLDSTVAILQSLPGAANPAVAARIQAARAKQAVLKDDPAHGNGMKQLAVTAARHEHAAAHSLHREHAFAGAAGALQIAILIASVSIVTRMRALRWGAGLIGTAAIGFGLLVWTGLV